ncbi:hypothetical protein HRED_06335 [Candidatus Haloredivivus sp. G17]|nr:hypothetical protein HRED_06335 [Candidatus Haloredivivus sp. G17]
MSVLQENDIVDEEEINETLRTSSRDAAATG